MPHFETQKANFNSFLLCTSGTTAIEYGFIALLISTGMLMSAGAIGSSSIVTFEKISQV